MMLLWSGLSRSETWITSRYQNLLDCCHKLMTCVQANALGDAICENVLQILDIGPPKPRFWKGPDQLLLAGDIGKWSASWWDLGEWAPILIPELQEFRKMFAQMDILYQKLTKFWSRYTLICERVFGNLTPTPPGVEFWRTETRLILLCRP